MLVCVGLIYLLCAANRSLAENFHLPQSAKFKSSYVWSPAGMNNVALAIEAEHGNSNMYLTETSIFVGKKYSFPRFTCFPFPSCPTMLQRKKKKKMNLHVHIPVTELMFCLIHSYQKHRPVFLFPFPVTKGVMLPTLTSL